jgi:hypothetical protein
MWKPVVNEYGETTMLIWDGHERVFADRDGGGSVEKKTFDMTVQADRLAFHAEASSLAKERGTDFEGATTLLADRVTWGLPERSIDTNDPAVRAALAAEAKKRVELSRVESIRSRGDESEALEFSLALDRVVADIRAGETVAGVEPKEKP